MPEAAPNDLHRVLARRGHLVAELLGGTTDRRELHDKLDESRSTVYRGLDQLEEYGFVTEIAGEYEVTAFGRIAFAAFEQFDGILDTLSDSREIFESSNVADTDLPPELFSDAEVTKARHHVPTQLCERLRETVSAADFVRGIVSTIPPETVEEYCRDEMTARFVFSEATLDYLRSDFSEEYETLASSESVTLYESTDEPPFGLFLLGNPTGRVVVVLRGEVGEIRGLVECDDPAAISWAEDRFESARRQSSPIDDRPRPMPTA